MVSESKRVGPFKTLQYERKRWTEHPSELFFVGHIKVRRTGLLAVRNYLQEYSTGHT